MKIVVFFSWTYLLKKRGKVICGSEREKLTKRLWLRLIKFDALRFKMVKKRYRKKNNKNSDEYNEHEAFPTFANFVIFSNYSKRCDEQLILGQNAIQAQKHAIETFNRHVKYSEPEIGNFLMIFMYWLYCLALQTTALPCKCQQRDFLLRCKL